MPLIIGHKPGPLGNVPVTVHSPADGLTPRTGTTDVRLAGLTLLGWAFYSPEIETWVARTFAGYDCLSSTHDTQMEALRAAGGI